MFRMCLHSEWQHTHELLDSNSTKVNGLRGFPQPHRSKTPTAAATCTPTVNGVRFDATQRFQLIHGSKLCTYVNSELQIIPPAVRRTDKAATYWFSIIIRTRYHSRFVSSPLKMEAPRSSKSWYLSTKLHMKPIVSDFISRCISSFKLAFLRPSFSFAASRQIVNHEMLQNLVYLQVQR